MATAWIVLFWTAPNSYAAAQVSAIAEHRTAFLELAADITAVSLNGRAQLERGLALTRQLTATVLGDKGDGGYDATGSVVPGSVERRLVDRSM